MTVSIIITLCVLLLIAYGFDISASRTKIPSVILLLILGWLSGQASDIFNIYIPDLNPVLPVLGTIGLILIVLEGALELEFNATNYNLIGKSNVIALLPILLFSLIISLAFNYYENVPIKTGLANALPFAVISSAIAIPTAYNLLPKYKSFITFESSMSDIFGVILFNFITLNEVINAFSVGKFFIEIALMLIVALLSTTLLSILLSKINHHVKFVPIMVMVVLIFTIAKYYHLPSLIFILVFGLFLGNIDALKNNKYIEILKPDILKEEVRKFKEIMGEIVFLIRSLFFLLFGFLIETSELLNANTIVWALVITGTIFATRLLMLLVYKLPLMPLLFIAPRGLITILLFLSIPVSQQIEVSNKSLIIQVIAFTSFIMMFGMLFTKNQKSNGKSFDVIQ